MHIAPISPIGRISGYGQNQEYQRRQRMTYAEAKALIEEARKLGYRGTDWEQGFVARLEAMQPAVLLPEHARSVEEFYRRATDGGNRCRHQVIGAKHRYMCTNAGVEA